MAWYEPTNVKVQRLELEHKAMLVDLIRSWITYHNWIALHPDTSSVQNKAAKQLAISLIPLTANWLYNESLLQKRALAKGDTTVRQNVFGKPGILPRFIIKDDFFKVILPLVISYGKGTT